MTLENSNNKNIISIINDNDNQRMVISNLAGSTSTDTNVSSSSSSRRKKGKPQKCVESTLANGSADSISLPSTTTSLLGESNHHVAEDSGIEASFNSILANLLPSTSIADIEAETGFHTSVQQQQQQLSPHQQLVQTLEACLNGTFPNFGADSVSSSMIPPQTANSLLASSFFPSLTQGRLAQKSTPTSSKKRKLKQVKVEEEHPQPAQPVTLPEGFEKLLEKVKAEPSSILDLNGSTVPALNNSIIEARPESASESGEQCSPPKKKKEGRCETKATIQAADGTIVEGNYDAQELNEFVKDFKILRNKYGFTQGDVGAALGKRYGADFSQTTISRFEALNLSYKNMCKLRPLLEEWLRDLAKAVEDGVPVSELLTMSNFDSDTTTMVSGSTNSNSNNNNNGFFRDNQSGSNSPESRPLPVHVSKLNATIIPPIKKRRKRTNLDDQQKTALDAYFTMNQRPDCGQINEIANALKLEGDVVRVWFCNRRQKIRKTEE